MMRTVKGALKPDSFTVSPGTPFKGMLVFLLPVKVENEATILLPARSTDAGEGIIEIPFTLLGKYDNGDLPVKNTGIFAQ
jgi:hypothetical protein